MSTRLVRFIPGKDRKEERTMRVICAVFLVTSALSFAGIAIADEQKRTAVVVDTTGQSTEVTDLYSHMGGGERYGFFGGSTPCLVVETGTFEIAIPLENLVSVARTGELSTVKYVLKSQEFTATGKLGSTDLTGKSDFGSLSISTAKIRRIDFKSPPTPGEEYEYKVSKPPVPATLTLLDDSVVPVTRLRRFYRYFSTFGYIMGGEWKPGTDEVIEFIRGESKSTVTMENIAKVEFGAGGALSITLRNGNSATGKLGSEKVVEGFCGTFEKGYFFIDKKHIKSIQFGGESK